MADYLAGLVAGLPNPSIEDGMSEDDFEGWKALTDKIGAKCQLVGDDLFVTNPERLPRMGIQEGLANSLLVKVNQIGTLSETMDAVSWRSARAIPPSCRTARAKPRIRPSPTSPSPPIAGRSKPAASRGQTGLAKYNQLIRIEEELGMMGRYAGTSIFAGLKN